MCGRITQTRTAESYAREMGWTDAQYRQQDWQPNWNVPPGSEPLLMHQFGGKRAVDSVPWGFRPKWAVDRKLPMMINARLEKAATGPAFRGMFRNGRAIVPAEGWFEWTGEKGHKQPWYIKLKSGGPMFLAAITDFRPDRELQEGSGFVIVTAAAEGGLVDVHDRRPVVLAAEDALLWMDNSLSSEQAEQIARQMALGPDCFEWFMVSTEVNRAGRSEPFMVEALANR
ncbi:SOS response-associated peptidase [Glaciimonas immobilis]|nr:SOS response-associated peptidase [Glaciimonas immobilis]KAF3999827.1 SOS response-associated peptidase [Glaciimonas immobilis]